jgi:hypothetical protein
MPFGQGNNNDHRFNANPTEAREAIGSAGGYVLITDQGKVWSSGDPAYAERLLKNVGVAAMETTG